MDPAVGLVNAYLHANGYLTVTEYPLVETRKDGQVRSRTDLDVIAFRFAHVSPGHRRLSGAMAPAPDPALRVPVDRPDLIIGEVKEGTARFNEATRDSRVLRAGLTRFGCCTPEEADAVVPRLLSHGDALTPAGHHVRMVAFGTAGSEEGFIEGRLVVELGQVIRFLMEHLAVNRAAFRAAQTHDEVLGILALLDKSGVDVHSLR